MFHRVVLALSVLILLAPAAALAGKPVKRKPMQLDPLGVEVAAKGEYTDDLYKVLWSANGCLEGDRNWQREQERPGSNVPVYEIYELLSSSVVCWQMAEKKAGKAGDVFAAAAAWIVARARYIEAYRGYMWAIDAKLEGDRSQVCRRLAAATPQVDAAVQAATGLADAFSQPDGKSMGLQLQQESLGLKGQVEDEIRHQKCE